MKPVRLAVIPLVAIAAACDSSSKDTTSPPTPITNMTQAASASAAATQVVPLALDVATSLSDPSLVGTVGTASLPSTAVYGTAMYKGIDAAQATAMSIQQSKLAASLREAMAFAAGNRALTETGTTTTGCADGGSKTTTATVDNVTGTITETVTYANCRNNGVQINGEGTMSVTPGDSFTLRAGDGDGIIDNGDYTEIYFTDDNTYSEQVGSYVADMTMSFSVSCIDDLCTGFQTSGAVNGKAQSSFFSSQYEVAYNNFSVSGSQTSTGTGYYTANYTVNGGVSESRTSNSATVAVALSFGNLTLGETVTPYYVETSADGTIAMNFTPNETCFEGLLAIDTRTPIRRSFGGVATQGKVVINGNVTIDFNPDGTVTVTLAGEPPQQYTYASYQLGAMCAVQGTVFF